MGLVASGLQVGAAAIGTDITYVSLHTAAPDGTGSSESTAARQPVTWTVSGGVLTANATLHFTGGAASGTVWGVGYWTAATGGTFRGSQAKAGGSAAGFNSAGQCDVTGLTITLA